MLRKNRGSGRVFDNACDGVRKRCVEFGEVFPNVESNFFRCDSAVAWRGKVGYERRLAFECSSGAAFEEAVEINHGRCADEALHAEYIGILEHRCFEGARRRIGGIECGSVRKVKVYGEMILVGFR